MLYRSTDRLCRCGAPVQYLSHSASFHSLEKYAPPNAGTKHLVRSTQSGMEGSLHAGEAVHHSPPLGMSTRLLPSQQVIRGIERDLVHSSCYSTNDSTGITHCQNVIQADFEIPHCLANDCTRSDCRTGKDDCSRTNPYICTDCDWSDAAAGPECARNCRREHCIVMSPFLS